MKLLQRFTRPNPILSYLRIAMAGSLVIAAAALGFTAVRMSGPATSADSVRHAQAVGKFRQDPDELFGNKVTRPGISRDRGPHAAAVEKFYMRAYPAADVPSQATKNAIAAFKHFEASSSAVAAPDAPAAQWQLIGPSNAVFPDILTLQWTTVHHFRSNHRARDRA